MALQYFLSAPFTYAGGGVAVGQKVWVFFNNTTAMAPIYHNAEGSRKPNPLKTDAAGRVEFYAEAGDYELLVNGVRFEITVDGSIAGTDAAATALILTVGAPGGIGTGRGRVYNDTGRTLEIVAVRVTAVNVGGGGLLVDVNINGTSIYTQQANRPAVPAGAGTGTVKSTSFNTGAALADGNYITADVDNGSYDHLVVQVFVR